jgi:hypothetical protein
VRGIAGAIARALNPLAIAGDVGLDLDPWQSDVIDSRHDRLLINVCRQGGKSTATSLLAVNEATSEPGLILCASPSQRQSGELFRKILQALRSLEPAPRFALESTTRLELEGGSRIVALPGSESTVRGFSAPRLVLIDEAARVPDDLYAALRPMLATSGGRIVALSTPWGRRGWFFRAFEQDEGDTWQRFRVPATQCPRITPAFLAEELREIGPLRYASEYMCEFTDVDEALFPSALIEAALTDQVVPLWT